MPHDPPILDYYTPVAGPRQWPQLLLTAALNLLGVFLGGFVPAAITFSMINSEAAEWAVPIAMIVVGMATGVQAIVLLVVIVIRRRVLRGEFAMRGLGVSFLAGLAAGAGPTLFAITPTADGDSRGAGVVLLLFLCCLLPLWSGVFIVIAPAPAAPSNR